MTYGRFMNTIKIYDSEGPMSTEVGDEFVPYVIPVNSEDIVLV